MFTQTTIKVIGIAATAVGIGTTLVSDWVTDKKTDGIIEKKVAEALAKLKD